MEKVKKIKLFCVGIIIVTIILITIGTIFYIRKMNKPRNVILPAISEAMAQGMVKENEIYMVRVANPDEFGTGGWYYEETVLVHAAGFGAGVGAAAGERVCVWRGGY